MSALTRPPAGSPFALACLVPMAALAACTSGRMPAPIQHVVLVDLADDADIADMRRASDETLPRIKSVKAYVCGAPVDIGRTNVAKDYDLGIIVQFDSVDDYQAYLVDPLHVELVQKWRPKWKRSYIVDFAP